MCVRACVVGTGERLPHTHIHWVRQATWAPVAPGRGSPGSLALGSCHSTVASSAGVPKEAGPARWLGARVCRATSFFSVALRSPIDLSQEGFQRLALPCPETSCWKKAWNTTLFMHQQNNVPQILRSEKFNKLYTSLNGFIRVGLGGGPRWRAVRSSCAF